jgi:chromosome segregation ATPase
MSEIIGFVRGGGRATLLAAAALLLVAVPLRAQDEGIKQTERLIKASGETIQAIAEAKMQLQKTLDGYNTLVADQAKDRKGAYKTLVKDMDTARAKADEAGKRRAAMEQEAQTLFAGWSKSAEAISSEDLKKRSIQRLQDTQKRYDGILAEIRKAREQFDPLMKDLGDQVTYLGHDLNPSAAASLKPDADKLNEKAAKLLAQVDEANKAARDYINTLRPE